MDIPRIHTLFFMDLKEFQSRTIRVQVGQVDGITMSEAYGIEQLTVIVDGCRSPYNLVLAIAIDIGHG